MIVFLQARYLGSFHGSSASHAMLARGGKDGIADWFRGHVVHIPGYFSHMMSFGSLRASRAVSFPDGSAIRSQASST
jgi:hypothetical protein